MTKDKKVNKREFRICLLGASLDVGNMGCRALAASLIRLFKLTEPNSEISLLYGHTIPSIKSVNILTGQTVEVTVVNYRLSPRARLSEHLFLILLFAGLFRLVPFAAVRKKIINLSPWIKSIAQADLIGEINGGDSFSDIYGLSRLIVCVSSSLIAILMKKPLVQLPQTYGPYNSLGSRMIARFILSHSDRIYSRDRVGIDTVNRLLGSKGKLKRVQFCPDVAFCLEPINLKPITIIPTLPERTTVKLVGFNVSGLLYMGGYTRDNMFGLRFNYRDFVSELLTKLFKTMGVHVLLVPHTFGNAAQNDQDVCRTVWQSAFQEFGERIHLLNGEYDQNELKAIIRGCDFFIGSRMHACIAALSQGIPSVGIAYSPKFRGVFESVGMGDMVLDAREVTLSEATDACVERFERREILSKDLAHTIPGIIEQVKACFTNLAINTK